MLFSKKREPDRYQRTTKRTRNELKFQHKAAEQSRELGAMDGDDARGRNGECELHSHHYTRSKRVIELDPHRMTGTSKIVLDGCVKSRNVEM